MAVYLFVLEQLSPELLFYNTHTHAIRNTRSCKQMFHYHRVMRAISPIYVVHFSQPLSSEPECFWSAAKDVGSDGRINHYQKFKSFQNTRSEDSNMQKFPHECHKISWCCWECTVYVPDLQSSRPPIALKPASSPPERSGLDNFTAQS